MFPHEVLLESQKTLPQKSNGPVNVGSKGPIRKSPHVKKTVLIVPPKVK